jgi:hypothetical protein
VSVYSHLSDRLGVYGTLVISCAPREATYVLTGILHGVHSALHAMITRHKLRKVRDERYK